MAMPPQLTLLAPPPQTIRFNGKTVERVRVKLAEDVLGEFNRQTGGRRSPYKGNGDPSDSLTRILGAVLAWPDLNLVEWSAVIGRALAEPWWSGRPSVGCVFGPRVVEQYIFPAAPAVESVEAREARERRERRARQRGALAKLRGGFDDGGGVGRHLPAS